MKKSIVVVLALLCVGLIVALVLVEQNKPASVPETFVPGAFLPEASEPSGDAAEPSESTPETTPEAPETNVASDLYDGTAPVIFDMHRPMRIESEDFPGMGDPPPKSDALYLGWDGEFEVEVTGATAAETPEAAGVPAGESLGKSFTDDDVYLLLNLHVNNLSAQFRDGENRDTFYTNSLFSLLTSKPFAPEVFDKDPPLYPFEVDYFSAYTKRDDSYCRYSLPLGSEDAFELGFYIPQKTLEDDILILLVGNGENCSFGIRISDISEAYTIAE